MPFRKGQIPWNRLKPNLNPTGYLAYILGVMLGDGYSHRRGRGDVYVELGVKDRDFINEFALCLRNIGLNPSIRKRRGYYWLYAYSIEFYNWYESLSLEEIKTIIKDFKVDFLRGFYDSEGNLSVSAEHGCAIRIVNCRLDFLQILGNFLKNWNIKHSIYFRESKKPNESGIYELKIGKQEDIVKFMDIIDPTIKRDGIDIVKQRLEKRNKARELYRQCMELRNKGGWGYRRIARELGISPNTVGTWLYKYQPKTYLIKKGEEYENLCYK